RRHVALALEYFGQCWIFLLDAAGGPGNPDGSHAGTDRHLSHNECGAPSGAARLTVMVGEKGAVPGDAVDVRRATHHAVCVDADIPSADVVTPDDDDVWFLILSEYAGSAEDTC